MISHTTTGRDGRGRDHGDVFVTISLMVRTRRIGGHSRTGSPGRGIGPRAGRRPIKPQPRSGWGT